MRSLCHHGSHRPARLDMNKHVRTLISSRSTMSCITKGGVAAMVGKERVENYGREALAR